MQFPLKGDLLSGRYEIADMLGEGTFGRVYQATDNTTGGPVAVKILKAGQEADAERLARFNREIHTLRRLEHEYILQYVDHGRQGGMIYLVTELLSGRSLLECARDFLGQPERVLLVGSRLAAAFAYAHGEGVIHRDIKPENILITGTGEPRILDYGLARWDTPEGADPAEMGTVERLTMTNAVMGTIPYMSPEQIRAERLDARSDVFSLAVVLFELACGRRPYEAPKIEKILETMESGDPPRLASLAAGMDAPPGEALDLVLRRALHPHRHQRIQHMAEFADAMDKALDLGSTIPKEATTAILLPPDPPLARPDLCIPRGREREIAALEKTVADARSGGLAGFVLSGPAGSGRSLLLSEIASHAHANGCLCLVASIPPGGDESPLAPLGAWLRRAADIFPSDDAVTGARDTLARPAAERRSGTDGTDGGLERTLERAAVALARRMPLALLIDDLHNARPELVSALVRIATAVKPTDAKGLLLGVTARSDAAGGADPEAPDPVERVLPACGPVRMERIELDRLDSDDLEEIASDLYPGLELAAEALENLQRQSGGNPAYARSILGVLEERGSLTREGSEWSLSGALDMPAPPQARDVLEERLAGIEAGDLEVLEAAAVAGGAFGSGLLAGILGLEADALTVPLRRLARGRRLIVSDGPAARAGRAGGDGEGYRFDQPLTREILLERLSGDRRAALHLAAAVALGGSDPDAGEPRRAGAAGLHLLEAGKREEALACLVSGGLRLHAADEAAAAIPFLAQAGDLIEEGGEPEDGPGRERLAGIRLALGQCLESVARHADALEQLEKARRLATECGRKDFQARSLVWMSRALLAQGEMLKAERRAKDAERLARRSALNAELGLALSAEANALSRSGDLYVNEAEEMWTEAIELLDAEGKSEEAAEVHFRLGNHFFRLDRHARAEESYAEAAQRTDRRRNPRQFARIQNARAGVVLASGRPAEALPLFEEAAEIRRGIGARRGEAVCLHNIACSLQSLGRLEEADETYGRVLAMRRDMADRAGEASALRNHAEVLLSLGRLEPALAEAGRAVEIKRALEDLGYVPDYLNLLGDVELQLGRPAEARRAFEEVLRDFTDRPAELLHAAAGSALAAWLEGDERAAGERFDVARGRLDAAGRSPGEMAARIRILEHLARSGAAAERLKEAAGPLLSEAETGRPPEEEFSARLARGLVAEGEGRTGDARAGFEEALRLSRAAKTPEWTWRLLLVLARLPDEDDEARGARRREAAGIIRRQAGTIESEELRTGYLSHRERKAALANAPAG